MVVSYFIALTKPRVLTLALRVHKRWPATFQPFFAYLTLQMVRTNAAWQWLTGIGQQDNFLEIKKDDGCCS